MKKTLCFVLSICLLVSAFIIPASAETVATTTEEEGVIVNQYTEVWEDGTIVEVTVREIATTASARSATNYTKTGSKTYTALNGSEEVMWRFTVHGSFYVVHGQISYCTKASYSISDVDSAWYLYSASTEVGSDHAIGYGTFKRKLLGIVVETEECTVTLYCDKNGFLS